jgi:hypothetical protein
MSFNTNTVSPTRDAFSIVDLQKIQPFVIRRNATSRRNNRAPQPTRSKSKQGADTSLYTPGGHVESGRDVETGVHTSDGHAEGEENVDISLYTLDGHVEGDEHRNHLDISA